MKRYAIRIAILLVVVGIFGIAFMYGRQTPGTVDSVTVVGIPGNVDNWFAYVQATLFSLDGSRVQDEKNVAALTQANADLQARVSVLEAKLSVTPPAPTPTPTPTPIPTPTGCVLKVGGNFKVGQDPGQIRSAPDAAGHIGGAIHAAPPPGTTGMVIGSPVTIVDINGAPTGLIMWQVKFDDATLPQGYMGADALIPGPC